MNNYHLYRQAGRPAGKRPGAAPARSVQDKHNWLADLAEWMMKDEVRAAEFPVTTLEEVQAERDRLAGKLHSLDVSLDLVQNAPYQRQALECMTCAWNDVIDATETIDAVCRGTLGCIRKGGDARADMAGCPLWQGEADLLAPHRKGVFEIPDMGLTLSDFTMKAEALLAAARARKDAAWQDLCEDAAPAPAADEEEPKGEVEVDGTKYYILDDEETKAALDAIFKDAAAESGRTEESLTVQADVLRELDKDLEARGMGYKKRIHRLAEAEALLNEFCARMQRVMNQKGGRA